jgi:hypothetical protein
VEQTPEAHFSMLVAVKNQPVVKTRHKDIPSGVRWISITPNWADIRMLLQPCDGCIHRIDKPQGSGRIGLAQIECLALKSRSNWPLFVTGVNASSGRGPQRVAARDPSLSAARV